MIFVLLAMEPHLVGKHFLLQISLGILELYLAAPSMDRERITRTAAVYDITMFPMTTVCFSSATLHSTVSP